MHDLALRVTSLLFASCLPLGLCAQDDPWQIYLAGKQPSTTEVPALLSKLSDMLGARDPKQRDEVAYTLLSRWTLRDGIVDDLQCARLFTAWTSNLRHHIEPTPENLSLSKEQQDEAVLRRSFSALSLTLLAARDNQQQFLDEQALDQLVTATANYLREEPDERGYVKQLGWVHATAHAADLVRQLAKNPRLTRPQQSALLNGVLQRVHRIKTAFTASEDDRLARAVIEVVHRASFYPSDLRAWLTSISNLARPTEVRHSIAFGHNRRLLVQSVLTRLLLDKRQTEVSKACVELTQQTLQGKFQKPR